MIFTSYFAKTKKFPDNFIPISVSQWPPKGYKGLECKILAPTKEILLSYKNNNESEEIKKENYTRDYKKDILAGMNFKSLLKDLENKLSEDVLDNLETEDIWTSQQIHLVFTCFEKSGDFCHRNLIAEEMKKQGIPCKELDDTDLVKMGLQLGYQVPER